MRLEDIPEDRRSPDPKIWPIRVPLPLIEGIVYFLYRLVAAGYISEYRVKVRGLRWFTVDFANPKTKDIIEFDSPYHEARLQRMRDADRDKRFQEAGWTVTRIPHD